MERINRLTGVTDQVGSQLAPPTPVQAICALGDPQSFIRALTQAGYAVGKRIFRRDHQPLPPEVLEAIRGDGGAPWVTTEKDAVRIPAGQFPRNLYTARMDCKIPEGLLQYLQLFK
jgi:tetraacyldisaccharide-1-P 4'-kinase